MTRRRPCTHEHQVHHPEELALSGTSEGRYIALLDWITLAFGGLAMSLDAGAARPNGDEQNHEPLRDPK
jgi:hypothetical protein